MRKRYIIAILGLLALGAGGVFAWQKYGGLDGNRLKDEISPYLLLHAHNPVDWYPWGEEALERARREQKPIFLSVGYSTCYWCHVMERRVFSNPDIAAIMNEHFINIKVDREERPDLDEVYMTATQLMTGSGGWPNSVFLTPDLKPFYGGTYFPPEDLPGRPAFPKVAFGMSQTFQNERAKAEEYADQVTKAIRAIQADAFVPDDSTRIDRSLVNRAVDRLKSRYDVQNGGFGGAPKFPQPMQLELLLSDYEYTGDVRILPIVTHTLNAMARGGMYDHVGGGFHRYATDVRWRIPHFEKMLYSQSDLSRIYLMAYRITGNAFYLHVAEDILAFVTRDMLGEDGAFYSAVDSETDTVEGQYYLWSDAEIKEVLGDDAELFFWVYGLTPMPDGKGGVLYKASAVDSAAFEIGMAPDDLRGRVKGMSARLMEHRASRKSPLVDTKVLTAWNGLMIDSYAYAYEVTGSDRYRRIAARAADFLLTNLRTETGDLMRTYRNGVVKYRAYQEDYAFLIQSLIRLNAVTGEARWQEEARALTDRMIETFWDDLNGGFFFTDGEDSLIVRTKNPFDAAQPSGNSVGAHVLVALARATGSRAYYDRAFQTFRAFAKGIQEEPGRFTHQITALNTFLNTNWDDVLNDPAHGSAPVGQDARSPLFRDSLMDLMSNDNVVVHPTLSLAAEKPKKGELFDAVVHIRIDPGWHINAMPATTKDLIPTSVVFNADVPIEVVAIEYPKGRNKRLAFSEQPLSIYQDEIEIRATLRIPFGTRLRSGTELRAILTYQTCNDAVCMAPGELQRSVLLRE